MELLSSAQIKEKVNELLNLIPKEENCTMPVCFNDFEARNTETPLIEVGDKYHYKYYERGQLTMDKATTDINELLYWIMRSATFRVACDYELKHRVADVDCRRMIFAKEFELFRYLGGDFEERHKIYIDQILKMAPYRD